MTTSATAAVTVRVRATNPASQKILDRQEALLAVIPRLVDRDRFLAVAVTLANTLAKCDPDSVVRAVYGVARLGLDPDPALQKVFVIPRNAKGATVPQACVQLGYRGMVELARRSREIAGIHAEVVYEGEKFNVSLGTKRAIEHEPWYLVAGAEPGKIILAYATWVDVATGHTEFHVCARDRLNRAKDAAQTDMVWRSDPAAMCRKTAIIDASRFWTLSPEAQQAVAWEEQAERGEAQTLPTDDQGDPAKPGDPLAGFADPPAGQTPPPDQGPVTDDDLNRVMDV